MNERPVVITTKTQARRGPRRYFKMNKKFRVAVLDHSIGDIFEGVYRAVDTNDVVCQIHKKSKVKGKVSNYDRDNTSSFIIPPSIGKKLAEATEASGEVTDFCNWKERCGNEDFDAGFSAGVLWLLHLFEEPTSEA